MSSRVHSASGAAVFCLDEKTAIQALDGLDPVLPLSPSCAERHGFEYYSTLSPYAALDTATGMALGPANVNGIILGRRAVH